MASHRVRACVALGLFVLCPVIACGGSDDSTPTGTTGGSGAAGAKAGAAGSSAGGGAIAGTGGKSAGSGGASAGSGGASAGSGGASAGSGGACPNTLPKPGSPCSPEGLSCAFGACCAPVGACVNGVWQIAQPPCQLPKCPDTVPLDGSSCDPCSVPATCTYDTCTLPNGEAVSAACEGDAWSVAKSSCDGTFACGPDTCKPGEVCVRTAGGPGFSYACQKNPCVGAPLSCACAASLCGAAPFECQAASGHDVSCVCPICP